ncbi:MAG: SPOR domain-containing protein [Pseudomonadota bacterium]
MKFARFDLFALPAAAFVIASGIGGSAQAQNTTSRPVVQPLPSAEVRDLNQILGQLARRPRDLDTLVEAGNASLKLDDLDAAIGFFGRAEEVSPNNPRVKMGMAAVFLRSGRAIEALSLFAEAEAAGATPRDVLSDRGLAYDLVGDQVRAQALYREALRIDPKDNTTVRRLAVSEAIVGEQLAFEATLRPLIEKRDFAAFRAQAFGLAILGEQDRAAAIASAVMPRDLAANITPYLSFMPRLTKGQQAAAANLGIFPKPADIGREDPRIAGFAAETPDAVGEAGAQLARSATSRLEPAGEPFGQSVDTQSEAELEAAAQRAALSAEASTLPVQASAEAEREDAIAAPPVEENAVVVAEAAEVVPPPQPGFDLAAGSAPASDAANPVIRVTEVESTEPAPTIPASSAPVEAEPSFADAFAEFGTAGAEPRNESEDAVDLESIEIRRDGEQSAAEPAGPENPSRIWIQVATGKDRAALAYDWRRIARKAPELLGDFEPHVVAWGQSNRLLAGPVSTRTAARQLVRDLGEAGVDTFAYTSPEGTEIEQLK